MTLIAVGVIFILFISLGKYVFCGLTVCVIVASIVFNGIG